MTEPDKIVVPATALLASLTTSLGSAAAAGEAFAIPPMTAVACGCAGDVEHASPISALLRRARHPHHERERWRERQSLGCPAQSEEGRGLVSLSSISRPLQVSAPGPALEQRTSTPLSSST